MRGVVVTIIAVDYRYQIPNTLCKGQYTGVLRRLQQDYTSQDYTSQDYTSQDYTSQAQMHVLTQQVEVGRWRWQHPRRGCHMHCAGRRLLAPR